MRQFEQLFGVTSNQRIIDIGGTEFNWQFIKAQPSVVLVNLGGEEWKRGRFSRVRGDARHLDYPDRSFDIAYSNSVIEHVGGWADMERFAAEIKRLAPKYYVQTPNRYFFVEPHLIAPFVHYLPFWIQRRIVRYVTMYGILHRPTQEQIDTYLKGIRLLTKSEFRKLFPDATIVNERFLGLTKSFIAIKR